MLLQWNSYQSYFIYGISLLVYIHYTSWVTVRFPKIPVLKNWPQSFRVGILRKMVRFYWDVYCLGILRRILLIIYQFFYSVFAFHLRSTAIGWQRGFNALVRSSMLINLDLHIQTGGQPESLCCLKSFLFFSGSLALGMPLIGVALWVALAFAYLLIQYKGQTVLYIVWHSSPLSLA